MSARVVKRTGEARVVKRTGEARVVKRTGEARVVKRTGEAPASRANPTRQVRPRRTEVRERVLAAALAVFTEVGYDRASLERVAAAAGFSKGAVYSNFASKDDLFVELMDQQVAALVAQARAALSEPHEPHERGRLLGDRLAGTLSQDRRWQLLFLDYVVRAIRDPALSQQFAAHRRRVRSVVADAVTELVGPIPPFSAQEAASIVLALSNGLAIEALTDPGEIGTQLFGRALDQLITSIARD